MNYEAVFIDWHGTLSNSGFWERWRDDPKQAEKYAKIQHALFQTATGKDTLKYWMTGFRDYEDTMADLSKWTKIDYEELEDELRHSAENMQFIDRGVLATIQQLRDIGKHVIVATDNMDTFNKWTVPAMNLYEYFDEVLTSYDRGQLKVASSRVKGYSMFFNGYMNKMGFEPKNTVLIDDSYDALCLRDTGMEVLHVTNDQPLSHHLDMIIKNN